MEAQTGPVVDHSRCEGKGVCVAVCPFHVFEVRRMDDGDFARLSWMGKLKSRAHRRQTAYTPRLEQCRVCGLCVTACPEKAIRLVRDPEGSRVPRDELAPKSALPRRDLARR